MTNKQKIFTVYAATFLGTATWIAAIVLAPLLKMMANDWGSFLYAAFSPVCHQTPERCFHLWGFPLAVCARCLGIYSGILIGLIVFAAAKRFSSFSLPKTSLFALLTTPVFMDTAGNILHLWTTSHWLRFATGSIWGIILPFYFVSGLSEAWIRRGESKQN